MLTLIILIQNGDEIMNLEQLEYVVEIAKTQSFSAASEHLHVTQSAISQSV
ncbi:TPA: LysR family transcriptional regulator, partial [Clostridioides difficile]